MGYPKALRKSEIRKFLDTYILWQPTAAPIEEWLTMSVLRGDRVVSEAPKLASYRHK